MSLALQHDGAASARSSPTMQRASVDLPEPDSPTSASERPLGTSRLTPATARTRWPAESESAAAAGVGLFEAA